MKSLVYLSQYFIFRVFEQFILLFPEKIRFKFSESIGLIGYKLIKNRRLITLANLKLAFPSKSEEERKKIAIESYKTMAKTFIGSLWLEKYIEDDSNFNFHNLKIIEKAAKKGPFVLATMHIGHMESMLKVSLKHPFVTVAKKQRNPYINSYITKKRNNSNIILIEKDKGTSRKLFKYSVSNKNIALFTDHRDKGTKVNFFGKETVSPTGVATIALKYKRPIILVYCLFNKENKLDAYVKEIKSVTDPNSTFKANVHETTQKIMTEIEKIISKHPEQWMWFHDRWKLSRKLKAKHKIK